MRRGEPPVVAVSVRRLQGGRKSATHVVGADRFRVPLDALARALARALASAACVQPHAPNPTLSEVMVQGDVAAAVKDFLVRELGLPRECVAVEGEGAAAAGGGKRK